MAVIFKKTAVLLFLVSHALASSSKRNNNKRENKGSTRTRSQSLSKQNQSPLGASPDCVASLSSPSSGATACLQNLKLSDTMSPEELDSFELFGKSYESQESIEVKDILVDDNIRSFKKPRQEVAIENIPERLMTAINSENVETIRELLQTDIDINSFVSFTGYTYFMHAVLSGNPDILELFLSTGKVNPNIIDADGFDILSLTLSHFGLDMAKRLLTLPISLHPSTAITVLLNLYKNTIPVFYPMIDAMFETKQRCLEAALISMTRFAVSEEDLDLLKYLHSLGISLKHRFNGSYLIHFAVNRNNIDIINFLIENGKVDIDAVTGNTNLSAMVIACMNQNYKLVSHFIRMGAKVGIEYCIAMAMINNDLTPLETLIETNGSDLDKLVFPGQSNLLTFAVIVDNVQALRLLLGSGKIDPNCADSTGRTIFTIKSPEEMSAELIDLLSFYYIL